MQKESVASHPNPETCASSKACLACVLLTETSSIPGQGKIKESYAQQAHFLWKVNTVPFASHEQVRTIHDGARGAWRGGVEWTRKSTVGWVRLLCFEPYP